MEEEKIGIIGWGSISALGAKPSEVWAQYRTPKTNIVFDPRYQAPVAPLPAQAISILEAIRSEQKHYTQIDKSVLMAIYAARQALVQSAWQKGTRVGVNIGSSRGATGIWENSHDTFLQKNNLKTAVLTSPLTTLGNMSAFVARDLSLQGIAFGHSLTCSTAFHSILNAVAWMQAGYENRFIAGGSEAPLTPFTIAQMQALRIYAQKNTSDFPCRALDTQKTQNSMVLGEGAAVFGIEKNPTQRPLAWIAGVGYATEQVVHPTSISKTGICLQKSMQMALGHRSEVDVVITHTPGTIRGDLAEQTAISKVFDKAVPRLTNNKWKIGHTLGASGALSLEMALLLILHQEFIAIPYLGDLIRYSEDKPIKTVLINTVGFGGTAVSLLIKKADSP